MERGRTGVGVVGWQKHTTAVLYLPTAEGEVMRQSLHLASHLWENLNIKPGPDFLSELDGAAEPTSLLKAAMYVGKKRKQRKNKKQHVSCGG